MQQHTQGRVARQVQRTRQQLTARPGSVFRAAPAGPAGAGGDPTAPGRASASGHTRPLVTLWAFLYQVLSADQSCRAAVARLLAFLGLHDSGAVNPRRWPVLQGPQATAGGPRGGPGAADRSRSAPEGPADGLLSGRPLVLVDGTTASMPDTPANQKAYPQQAAQKPGLGFPIVRLVGLISLASGAVLDVAMAPYKGKRTGETTLLRQLLGSLKAGEILLGDAQFANYWTIALLLEQGVDLLARADGRRRVDFRTGQRLGRAGSRRLLAQAAAARLDEQGPVRPTAQDAVDPRGAGAGHSSAASGSSR